MAPLMRVGILAITSFSGFPKQPVQYIAQMINITYFHASFLLKPKRYTDIKYIAK